MKKFKIVTYTIICFALFNACEQNDSNNVEEVNSTQETSIEVEPEYNLLTYNAGIYTDYFKATTHSLGFSSLKANSLMEHSTLFRPHLNGDKISFSLNKKIINNESEVKQITALESSEIYGKTIKFKISSKNNLLFKNKKGTGTEISLYVPNLIKITNPRVTLEKELLPNCFDKNFVLEWNADEKNKEGLVVIAEYSGTNALPQNDTKSQIMNIDYITEDTGKTVLNKDIFKNIPNLSIVNLILLRGNVVIEEIEGEQYKFFAESHVRLPFILIKDLSTIKTF